jgi:hypothetical protein
MNERFGKCFNYQAERRENIKSKEFDQNLLKKELCEKERKMDEGNFPERDEKNLSKFTNTRKFD